MLRPVWGFHRNRSRVPSPKQRSRPSPRCPPDRQTSDVPSWFHISQLPSLLPVPAPFARSTPPPHLVYHRISKWLVPPFLPPRSGSPPATHGRDIPVVRWEDSSPSIPCHRNDPSPQIPFPRALYTSRGSEVLSGRHPSPSGSAHDTLDRCQIGIHLPDVP